MHAIQFSHRYVSCDPPIAWWDEGGATWAGNFVYPDDNYEQSHYGDFVKAPLADDLQGSGYESWPFWLGIQKTLGLDALRAMFTQMQTKRPVPAANAALSGGLAKQLPKYFLWAYNQSPIGDAGFEIPEAFKVWDSWSATPTMPAAVPINLGGLPVRTLNLKMQRKTFPGAERRRLPPGRLPRRQGQGDPVHERPRRQAGAHVDALLHLADGSWKLQDWSTKKTVTLCRDKDEENVTNLVIVTSNTSLDKALPSFTHKIRVRPSCPHAYKILAASQTELSNGQYDWTPDCPTLTGTRRRRAPTACSRSTSSRTTSSWTRQVTWWATWLPWDEVGVDGDARLRPRDRSSIRLHELGLGHELGRRADPGEDPARKSDRGDPLVPRRSGCRARERGSGN